MKDNHHVIEIYSYKNLKKDPRRGPPHGVPGRALRTVGPEAERWRGKATTTGEPPVRPEIRKSELSREIERKSEDLNLFI